MGKVGRKPKRGILGQPVQGSDEDSDYCPDDDVDGPAHGAGRRAASGKRTRTRTAAAALDDDDVPLAARIRAKAAKVSTSRSPGISSPAAPSGRVQAARAAATSTLPATGTSGGALPPDCLRIIFSYACKQGAIPTACILPVVCRTWREVAAAMPSLWEVIDFRAWPRAKPTDAVIERAVKQQRWVQAHTLRFMERRKLTDESLLRLAQVCPNLTHLDLSDCIELRADIVEPAIRQMLHLTHLNVSRCMVQPRTTGLDRVVRAALTPRPGQASCRLQVLIATSCLTLTRQTMQALFQAPPPSSRESGGGESEHGQQGEGVARASGSAAAAGGPQGGRHARPVAGSVPHLLSLREVDLRDSSRTDSRLPLNPERFQACAPHLQVLRLGGLGGVWGWDVGQYSSALRGGNEDGDDSGGPAWASLEVLDVGASELKSTTGPRACFSALNNAILLRLAGRSPLLHTLDLTGCNQQSLTPEVFARLPCQGRLRVLCIRRCSLGTNAGLIAAAAAFGSSLEELDVSGCMGSVTDVGIQAIAEGCPNLRTIDLSSSAVTEKGLKALLQSCKHLEGVLLNSCRGLDRDVRHQIADASMAQSSQLVSATPASALPTPASVLRRLLKC